MKRTSSRGSVAAVQASTAGRRRIGCRWLALVGIAAAGMPALAGAHVKWFVKYNLLEPPRPIERVVTSGYFIGVGLAVLALIFVVTVADRWMCERDVAVQRQMCGLSARAAPWFPLGLRLGVAVFLAAAFAFGCAGNVMILTPELHTPRAWICWLQIVLALLALTRRTAPLTGLGVVFLYFYGVAGYGLYHMLDYPIFVGIAVYLVIDGWFAGRHNALAHDIVRISAGVTLLWASIEKWAFPEWSFMLLSQRPGMTFGFNPEFYMVAAGFVEFCAAWLLITGLLSARAAALVLLAMFVSAIIPFGTVDAVGHLLIIVVMVMLIFGNNPVGQRLGARGRPLATGAAHAAAFAGALAFFFAIYYGGYYLSYGTTLARGHDTAAQTASIR
ncbi:MAG: DoxX family membrane protein [Proteobacteria bacterium]|nr:DoxX family membrane protein [Pseudomonadota bacterium]